MTSIAPSTSGTPVQQLPRQSGPDQLPPIVGGAGTGGGAKSLRLKITGWMEEKLGRAAMPVAAVAGGVAGGTLGMLTLGPVGAAVGGIGGAFMGAALFLAG